MLWLYIPPVIFVAALIFLVVVVGKKSAEMKKMKSVGADVPTDKSIFHGVGKSKKIWNAFLNFFEKFITALKTAVKKSELALARLSARIRSRRGKRAETLPYERYDLPSEDSEIFERKSQISNQIDKIDESQDEFSNVRKTDWISSEVSVKKKRPAPEPVIRMKEMPAPEDKVREDALIHRIAENPRDIEAYRELGDYYLMVGNIKDAKDSFKMVLKLRPRDLKAKSSLREIEMKMRLGN